MWKGSISKKCAVARTRFIRLKTSHGDKKDKMDYWLKRKGDKVTKPQNTNFIILKSELAYQSKFEDVQ